MAGQSVVCLAVYSVETMGSPWVVPWESTVAMLVVTMVISMACLTGAKQEALLADSMVEQTVFSLVGEMVDLKVDESVGVSAVEKAGWMDESRADQSGIP